MNRTALLLLAILAPSCGGTSRVTFSGEDNADGRTGFGVIGKKSKGRIYAMNPRIGFLLPLPYAEDWIFEPTEKKPLFGRSESLLMFATVQLHQPGRTVDEESYLRDEYLKNLKSNWEGLGISIKDVEIAKHGDHVVLEYVTEKVLPDGKPFRQTHFWTFRQHTDGMVYEAHVSTVQQTDPARAETCAKIRQILGREFFAGPKLSR